MNEIKSCKAPGLDGFPVQCLNKGGYCSVSFVLIWKCMVYLWTGAIHV